MKGTTPALVLLISSAQIQRCRPCWGGAALLAPTSVCVCRGHRQLGAAHTTERWLSSEWPVRHSRILPLHSKEVKKPCSGAQMKPGTLMLDAGTALHLWGDVQHVTLDHLSMCWARQVPSSSPQSQSRPSWQHWTQNLQVSALSASDCNEVNLEFLQ